MSLKPIYFINIKIPFWVVQSWQTFYQWPIKSLRNISEVTSGIQHLQLLTREKKHKHFTRHVSFYIVLLIDHFIISHSPTQMRHMFFHLYLIYLSAIQKFVSLVCCASFYVLITNPTVKDKKILISLLLVLPSFHLSS